MKLANAGHDFGRTLYENVELSDTQINEETQEEIKVSLGFFQYPITNPEYDATRPYTRRSERPEWDTVVLSRINGSVIGVL